MKSVESRIPLLKEGLTRFSIDLRTEPEGRHQEQQEGASARRLRRLRLGPLRVIHLPVATLQAHRNAL